MTTVIYANIFVFKLFHLWILIINSYTSFPQCNHSFIEEGTLYLVMEYCSRGSLRDRLIKAGKLDVKTATDIFLRLTHTFAFLHCKGFIHHDIKPDNLLFTDDKIKISDFGTVNTSIGTIIYSTPIGGGLFILLAAGAAYGTRKVYKGRGMKSEK